MQQPHGGVIRLGGDGFWLSADGNPFFPQGVMQGVQGKKGRVRQGGLYGKTRKIGGNGAVDFHFVLIRRAIGVGVVAFIFSVGGYETG